MLCGLRTAPIEDRLRGLASPDLTDLFCAMGLLMPDSLLFWRSAYRNYQCLYKRIFGKLSAERLLSFLKHSAGVAHSLSSLLELSECQAYARRYIITGFH